MIALVSDIHGNLPALRAVLQRIDSLGIEDIVCLGDTSGYAPEVNECCDELRARQVQSVLGNHDSYLADNRSSGRSATVDLCIAYQREIITPENLQWISGLPRAATWFEISVVHASWRDPLEEYLYSPQEDDFAQEAGGFFASGHTHMPLLWNGGGKRYCNPGSVGQPRDGDPRASFAVFDGERFRIERVEYDIAATRQAIAGAGLPDYVGSNLPNGRPIGWGRST